MSTNRTVGIYIWRGPEIEANMNLRLGLFQCMNNECLRLLELR
jgi:hypothetical protein